MTLRLERPVRRIARTRQSGELLVTMTPAGLMIRELGRRETSAVGPFCYGKLYLRGVTEAVAAAKAARVASRKLRRRA